MAYEMNSVIPKVDVYNEKLVAAVVTRCRFSPICITYRKRTRERTLGIDFTIDKPTVPQQNIYLCRWARDFDIYSKYMARCIEIQIKKKQ